MLKKIISGGQTGADRAALDWAIARGIAHGGWCPKGGRAEDGAIDARYALKETPSADYDQRTRWNVRDSDATLIISQRRLLSGGSRRTRDCAAAIGKPCLHVHAGVNAAELLREFLSRHRIEVLNVAGPRASSEAGIGDFVTATLNACADLLTAAD